MEERLRELASVILVFSQIPLLFCVPPVICTASHVRLQCQIPVLPANLMLLSLRVYAPATSTIGLTQTHQPAPYAMPLAGPVLMPVLVIVKHVSLMPLYRVRLPIFVSVMGAGTPIPTRHCVLPVTPHANYVLEEQQMTAQGASLGQW